MDTLNEVRVNIIRGRKREDQKIADASASGIPYLRINNAALIELDDSGRLDSEIAAICGRPGFA